MRLGPVILPEEICDKVEGFGDGVPSTAEPEPERFRAN